MLTPDYGKDSWLEAIFATEANVALIILQGQVLWDNY
jgi:hypothetical protein